MSTTAHRSLHSPEHISPVLQHPSPRILMGKADLKVEHVRVVGLHLGDLKIPSGCVHFNSVYVLFLNHLHLKSILSEIIRKKKGGKKVFSEFANLNLNYQQISIFRDESERKPVEDSLLICVISEKIKLLVRKIAKFNQNSKNPCVSSDSLALFPRPITSF